jgi:hypothetical protein
MMDSTQATGTYYVAYCSLERFVEVSQSVEEDGRLSSLGS